MLSLLQTGLGIRGKKSHSPSGDDVLVKSSRKCSTTQETLVAGAAILVAVTIGNSSPAKRLLYLTYESTLLNKSSYFGFSESVVIDAEFIDETHEGPVGLVVPNPRPGDPVP